MDIAALSVNLLVAIGLLSTIVGVAIKLGRYDKKNEADISKLKEQHKFAVSKESHSQTNYRVDRLEVDVLKIGNKADCHNNEIITIKENYKSIKQSQKKTDATVDKILDLISNMSSQLAVVVDYIETEKKNK